MASTGFKTISQVAEILGKPEIDEKERHFILDLLTKTLGENFHLKSTIDKKNQEMCDLHIDNRGYKDQVELLEKACERQVQIIRDRDQTIESLGNQLRKKNWEIEDLQGKIQEQDDNAERALGENAEVIEQLEEEIKMINESRQKVAKQLTEKDEEIEEHKKTIESLGDQLREKEKEIEQKTMELRQHSWSSNKMIYELQDKLDEKEKELEEIKIASHLKESSSPDEESKEFNGVKYFRCGEYWIPESRIGWENFRKA